MRTGGAGTELVATAQAQFAALAVVVEACDALHRDLSDEEFNCWTKLSRMVPGTDGATVLAWFLARNSSCAKLRRAPCTRWSGLRGCACV